MMPTASQSNVLIPCPVCGNNISQFIMQVQDWLVTNQPFDLLACPACTTRFIYPIPSEYELSAYYKSPEYISHTDTHQGLISWLYQCARKRTLHHKKKKIERVTGRKQGHILDIGAGTGQFLATMKEAGWHVTGVEPDQQARDVAKNHVGIDLFPLEDLDSLSEKSFDVITLWHVLEHVYDLHGMMSRIKKLIKDDGLLVIAVPNYQSDDADFYGSAWAAWDAPRHLYHFSPHAMALLMQKNTFRIIIKHRMPLDSFYVSLLSERQKNRFSWPRALAIGTKSWCTSWFNVDRCSSIIYFMRPEKGG